MRKLLSLVFCLVLSALALPTEASPRSHNLIHERARSRRTDPVSAVTGLVRRWFPDHLADFEFSVIEPLPDGRDVYQYANAASGSGAVISISGSSGVALASGLYAYLKDNCHIQISWNGDNIALPATLPAVSASKRVERATLYSYYQNVCTVSYSMAWWKWSRWQREIDWMAMNGINMPLAFTGQEFIWMKTYEDFGLSFDELAGFFSGPAFFAWQRMGNIQGWGGPLTMNFIMDSYELQLQILDRMRELDMIPVLPAFAGHIPGAMQTHFPSANITRSSNWCNFNSTYGSDFLLEANDPLYQKLGARFIELQTLYYGTDHVYNCDTFNEMRPASSDPAYLKASSQAVYKSMTAADPQAVWLMQGWLFFNDQSFWQPAQVQALLDGVPNDGMIVLDLFSDVHPLWQQTHNYYGKPWIWCTLHDFGGVVGLSGNLSAVSTGPLECLGQSNCTMVGVGLTMEGIFQNYIVYELTLDMSWRNASQPVDLSQYVKDYAYRRYGILSDVTAQAWEQLLQAAYSMSTDHVDKSAFEKTPQLSGGRSASRPSAASIKAAFDSLTAPSVVAALSDTETYRFDLLDVTRQLMESVFDNLQGALTEAFNSPAANSTAVQQAGAALLAAIKDIDSLLATSDHFLLGKWIADARAWAHTPAEADWLEYNARNQLTLWGPDGNINDYASKQWAGLVGDYYHSRWALLVDTLIQDKQAGAPFDQDAFDAQDIELGRQWCARSSSDPANAYPVFPKGDLFGVVSYLNATYFSSVLPRD